LGSSPLRRNERLDRPAIDRGEFIEFEYVEAPVTCLYLCDERRRTMDSTSYLSLGEARLLPCPLKATAELSVSRRVR
jgi:hypothetical protein